MKLMPYPTCKPSSSVPGLCAVPAHWKVKQLGRIGYFLKGTGGTRSDNAATGRPCVRYGDIYTKYNYHIRDAVTFISEAAVSAYTPIRFGDTLFAGSGETLDDIGKSVVNLVQGAHCGGDVIVLRPSRYLVDPEYFGYAMESAPARYQKACSGRGVTVMHIYVSELRNVIVALPPLDEQKVISSFLDHHTSMINTLIDKTENLIERLQEKRQALVNETVTRGLLPEENRKAGLDPCPKLKPSGVEWLDEIPEHWNVARLSTWATINDEQLPETTDADFEMRYIDIGSVDPDRGTVSSRRVLFEDAPSRARRVARVGDTIVSTVRTYLRGIATLHSAEDDTVVSTGFAVLRPKESLSPAFLGYVAGSPRFVAAVCARSVGVSYPATNASEIGTIVVALPDRNEQQAIAEVLSREIAQIDDVISKSQILIERLHEKRQALITAAVTGQIDVREKWKDATE